ncbi:hypothetical protein [Bradyrhizobium sp. 2S1]|uniref:hypothetical protein n=1 Tax=Bradyrhizobium sp. 2S1 TaxID=1404429 RepID=UPI00140B9B4B|nr:hypothetical protein [Bradyrhizobium sp. 2S1]MCK7673431.1 hypothetical protein [Bradyrhizobium sp. 2S1]
MNSFFHDENVALYRKLIAESESNPSRDDYGHAMLLTLLVEETAKAMQLPRLPDAWCAAPDVWTSGSRHDGPID